MLNVSQWWLGIYKYFDSTHSVSVGKITVFCEKALKRLKNDYCSENCGNRKKMFKLTAAFSAKFKS